MLLIDKKTSQLVSKVTPQAERNSPRFVNSIVVMKLSMVIETTSPIEAARGVARLSGFTLYLLESRITATSTKSVNEE